MIIYCSNSTPISANILEIPLCKCGCGEQVNCIRSDRIPNYLPGHHMLGRKMSPETCEKHRLAAIGRKHTSKSIEKMKKAAIGRVPLQTSASRAKRVRTKCGREPIYSPYLSDVIVCYYKQHKRWYCKNINKKRGRSTHARVVYEHTFGEVPAGFHVHHKNGDPSLLENDHPDNLMLLSDEWNLRFMPVLAKGFGIHESKVTEVYLEVMDDKTPAEELFTKVCIKLIERIDDEEL